MNLTATPQGDWSQRLACFDLVDTSDTETRRTRRHAGHVEPAHRTRSAVLTECQSASAGVRVPECESSKQASRWVQLPLLACEPSTLRGAKRPQRGPAKPA
jgi:hypothetical protein